MFIAIRSALRTTIAACEAGITSFAVSENSVSQRAKFLSSMGKGKCARSGLPLYRPVVSNTVDQKSFSRVSMAFRPRTMR